MTEGTEDEEEDLADARVGLGLHCLWCPTLRRRAGLREGLWRDVGDVMEFIVATVVVVAGAWLAYLSGIWSARMLRASRPRRIARQ